MNVRAIIFDVYQTLLEVTAPPANTEALWAGLWRRTWQTQPRLSLAEFAALTTAIIQREHLIAHTHGIAFPEIYWPTIAREALPELRQLNAAQTDEFLFQHAQTQHTVRLLPDRETINTLVRSGKMLGIASNAQPYTLRELADALQTANLTTAIFNPELCFWSFEHGFSKPNPHVFQILNARLSAHGIIPAETLMVGDRLDNDIAPAKAQGWQTWHLQPAGITAEKQAGNWLKLADFLHNH